MTAEPSLPDAPVAHPAVAPRSGEEPLLRLAAMDEGDLAVLSAHLQDMVVAVGDLAYLPAERRFALVGKRFDWVAAVAGGCERCASGLHFDGVTAVARSGFAQGEGDRQLNLLAIAFAAEADGTAAGTVTLTFSAGAALRLSVEYLEAQMRDLGERWPCDKTPLHP